MVSGRYSLGVAGSGPRVYCDEVKRTADMSTITVKTNNVPRDLISAFQLSSAQYTKLRAEYDWMEDQDFDYAMFFNYRGQVYTLADFMRTEGDILRDGWQGILNETFFSGIVVKIIESCERIVVGRYCV